MSGQYVTTVAARFPHRFAAAASLYGIRIVTDKPDSPHLLLDQIMGEMYYAFAEFDKSVPLEITEQLRVCLKTAGTKYDLEVFTGAHHGFAFPERQVNNSVAAEQTWSKMFALWERTLK